MNTVNNSVNNGLEGIVAAETTLSMVDGTRGELVIAGFPVAELALNATFEETVWLLWHGTLPDTVSLRTGGRGQHFYFQHPGVPIPNYAGKLGPGLDVRGEGGYVVAPPSIHLSGKPYEWGATAFRRRGPCTPSALVARASE